MKFDDIASGTSVFVDANVFVYAFAADITFGAQCTALLERIELGDLRGFISVPIFSEISHRLMTLEACQKFGWPYAGIAQRLRKHPSEVQKLSQFRIALGEIVAAGIHIHSISQSDVLRAAELSQTHGLLTNDATVVSVMEGLGLTQIASNDVDFDRVSGLTRYAPT